LDSFPPVTGQSKGLGGEGWGEGGRAKGKFRGGCQSEDLSVSDGRSRERLLFNHDLLGRGRAKARL